MRVVLGVTVIGLALTALGCCCGGAPTSNVGSGAGSTGTWVQDGDSVRLVVDDPGTSTTRSSTNRVDRERCLKEMETCSEGCDKKHTVDSTPYADCQDGCWFAKLACQDACPTCYSNWQEVR